MKRAAGILLPVFSLPGEYGIGGFSKEAYAFVDYLAACGQSYWQILPLGPVGFGASPYQPDSTFAGNALFLSPDTLCEEGLLKPEERDAQRRPQDTDYVNYEELTTAREEMLRTAFERFRPDAAYEAFCRKNEAWLTDYACFKVLKEIYKGAPWREWDSAYRLHQPAALTALKARYAREFSFYQFLEYEFDRQWSSLKDYANKKDVRIIGDLPIYVSMDSCDTWSHPELFQFDEQLQPKKVAGCPPDYFAEDGQLWGNPVYDWRVQEADGFSWWIARLRRAFAWYDVLRLDHFRGFASYYEIPSDEKTAKNGRWVEGPRMKFFDAVRKALGDVPIIAEDLGLLTPDVFRLLSDSGYPGMKVLEFAFDDSHDSLYLPHKYYHNCVVYTGTHDNDTLVGWIEKMGWEQRKFLQDYVGHYNFSNEDLAFEVVRLAMGSTADLAIIPMQDYLSLPSYARINTPSTVGDNWKWRMRMDSLSDYLCGKIGWLTELFGRKAAVPADVPDFHQESN